MKLLNLDELVDNQVAANPNGRFGDIADRVVDQIPDEQLRKLLSIALRAKIKRAMGARLAHLTHQHGPSKKAPRAVAAATEKDLLDQVVNPEPGRWKAMGACTADEIEGLAGYHAAQHLRHRHLQDVYGRIASAVRRGKHRNVRDLGTEAVLAEFDREDGPVEERSA